MAANRRRQSEILSEMTDIVSEHLLKFPANERKAKIKAFEKVINRGGKRASARPKAASTSRTQRKTRRIPA